MLSVYPVRMLLSGDFIFTFVRLYYIDTTILEFGVLLNLFIYVNYTNSHNMLCCPKRDELLNYKCSVNM